MPGEAGNVLSHEREAQLIFRIVRATVTTQVGRNDAKMLSKDRELFTPVRFTGPKCYMKENEGLAGTSFRVVGREIQELG